MPIKVGFMIREGQPLIINCWNFTYDKNIALPRVDLEVYADPPTGHLHPPPLDTPCIAPQQHRELDAGSPTSMMFVEESVRQCYTKHTICTQRPSDFVPTRLLSLGQSNEELRICESLNGDQGIAWAALSHCWGGKQPFRLLKENMHAVQRRIQYTDLPPTFQDAITVARTICLHYLWIDSICIIQDDRSDWEIEAARMGMVYGQASLVICAASSKDPLTSFLGSREQEWVPKIFNFGSEEQTIIPITVRKRHLLAVDVEQGLREPPFTSSWATLKRIGPLYERGWCWQETYLATRALHFAPGAIIFECKTHRRSNDQLPPYPSTKPGTLGNISEMEQWHMIVKSYTQRQLTFAGDILPAIGGAARKMAQAQRSAYLAGLWRETLLLDMLWQIMPGGERDVMTHDESEQAAPSWTWASMNRGVVWDKLESSQLLAEVIDSEMIPLSTDVYGQVAGGRICIRGQLTACTFTSSYHRLEY